MYQDGDRKGLSHAFKSVINDGTALIEATNHSFNVFPVPHLDPDIIHGLKDIPDSQVAEFFQADFFKPKLFQDIAVQMQNVVSVLEDVKSVLNPIKTRQRHLKTNLFHEEKKDDQKPFQSDQDSYEFGTKSNMRFCTSHWDFSGRKLQKALHQARTNIHLPDIGQVIYSGNDAHSANRCLMVNERQKTCLEAMQGCQPKCNSTNTTCNCDRLVGCISTMSDYDMALLFVGKYIDDENANLTAELSLFDADFNIIQRIKSIRNIASTKDCSNLLPELHSACNPLEESCSGENSHSFQLSVDDVCDGINTPAKLSLITISEELDGYWAEDGRESATTACHSRLAFSTCQDFVTELDHLYQGRDVAKYPHWNPIHEDPMIPADKSNFLQLPTNYKFKRSVHGTDMFATSMNDKVRVVSDMKKCMHAPGSTAYLQMVDCKTKDPNQEFVYNKYSREIMLKMSGQCVAYHTSTQNLYLTTCNGANNHKWHYNMISQEVKTLWNGRCLDLAGSGNLYMNANCHGGSNQKFMMPSQWFPEILSLNRVWVFSNRTLCMGEDNNSGHVNMQPCNHTEMNTAMCGTFRTKQRDYIGTINRTSSGHICQRWDSQFPHQHNFTANDQNYCRNPDNDNSAWCYTTNPSICRQDFEYDALTRQIKRLGRCIDYAFKDNYLYMNKCHDGKNQQFYFDSSTNRLQNGWDNKCLDWDGTQLYMTTCDDRSSEKLQIPTPWVEGISSSSFDEVRMFSNLNLCLTLEIPQIAGTPLVLQECKVGQANQIIFYDAETLEIKLWRTKYCVDYNFNNFNVYIDPCHGGSNQKWYHERTTNQLRSLSGNKCVDWGNGKLYMNTCHSGNNQKFLVPSLWFGQCSHTIHSFLDYEKCMIYNPDHSNNVYMSNCQEIRRSGHRFEYNTLTKEIQQDGLCLNIIINVDEWVAKLANSLAYFGFQISHGNTLMWPCNGDISQKWSIDFIAKTVKSNTLNAPCLHMENGGNIIGASCLRESSRQMFLFPESWTLNNQNAPQTIYPYHSKHISPAIWSSDVCHIDWLKNVIKTCDNSMALLLGSSTSLGTLRAIAKLVNNKGPQYMPGSCCLDDPMTSQFFGSHFDARTMDCQNPGPWHLGISSEACENAGGRWFRSPCVVLKECIDQRPHNSTDHFSPAFEDFAINLKILDPKDESRCREVRGALGFDSNHPFDTEVCQKFESLMCDKLFTEVDALVKDTVSSFTGIKYTPVEYPPDPQLKFDKLPERTGTYPAFQVPKFGALGHLDDLQKKVIALKHTVTALATDAPSRVADLNLGIEAMFRNFKVFDSWNTLALGTINKNMFTQHTQVRDLLQKRHTEMETNIGLFIAKVSNYQTEQFTYLNTTLKTMLSNVTSMMLSDFKSVKNEHDLIKNELNVIDLALAESVNDRQATDISCKFDLSLASHLTLNVVDGANSTLFVKEDTSQSAGVIPLVLQAEVSQIKEFFQDQELISLTLVPFPCSMPRIIVLLK
ncbi:hypothetical protein ACHAWX_005756 [Stephanocyclus meneghinianus]